MSKIPRTIIIGLDGVPFEMLKGLAQTGVMPKTADLISQGTFKKMLSSIPEVSSVAWSSVITGTNPGQHGIFGFTDLLPDSYEIFFPNFTNLKAKPFWEEQQRPSVIINVPSTYPVSAINGVLISGFVSIDFDKSIYPPTVAAKLRSMDYRLDVDSQKAHKSMDLFLEDLNKTLDTRIEAYKFLWDYTDWGIFMFVFTGTDRLMHFLWDAYADSNHKYHSAFLKYFSRLDIVIGEIASRAAENDRVIMLSDHGFEHLEKDVYVNRLLLEAGFLCFKNDDSTDLKNICFGTKAFALDPARIYINFKGKYPCGSVEPEHKEDVLRELEEFFNSYEVEGKKVFEGIYRREKIYDGACAEAGPEMVLVGAKGFNLKASLRTNETTGKGIFTGKHTQHDAFLLVRDNNRICSPPEKPSVSDIKNLVLAGR
jgi:predicted AlkP superfamily phosphohydrolase/phosphomutase